MILCEFKDTENSWLEVTSGSFTPGIALQWGETEEKMLSVRSESSH